jgi:hypothetical protein
MRAATHERSRRTINRTIVCWPLARPNDQLAFKDHSRQSLPETLGLYPELAPNCSNPLLFGSGTTSCLAGDGAQPSSEKQKWQKMVNDKRIGHADSNRLASILKGCVAISSAQVVSAVSQPARFMCVRLLRVSRMESNCVRQSCAV